MKEFGNIDIHIRSRVTRFALNIKLRYVHIGIPVMNYIIEQLTELLKNHELNNDNFFHTVK